MAGRAGRIWIWGGIALVAARPALAQPQAAGPATAMDILALPLDLTPWGMFVAADAVVKGVMLGLAFASLVTWTIGFAKAAELLVARSRLLRGRAAILGARDLAVALDYLFIVRLFQAVYYGPDVFAYYALTFLIPVGVGMCLVHARRVTVQGQ